MKRIITIVCGLLLIGATTDAVTLTYSCNGMIFGWQAADRVGFFTDENVQMSYTVADIAADCHSATVQSPGWSLKHDVCYYAYAPYNSRYTTGGNRATALPLDFSQQQQMGNDNTDHLVVQSFFMGKVTVSKADADVRVNLYPLTSVLRITEHMATPFNLSKVTVSVSNNKIPLLGMANLINGEFSPMGYTRTLTLNATDIHVAKDEDITVYLTLPPCNLEGEMIEIVFMDKDGNTDEWILPGFDILSGYTYCIGGNQEPTIHKNYTTGTKGTASMPVVLVGDMPIAGSYIATRVNDIDACEAKPRVSYGLSGLPLRTPYRGIVIRDGKKILMR